MSSIFAQVAPALVAGCYSPLPILPGTKRPALSGWEKYCNEAPAVTFVAGYSRAPAMGVGIACGFGGLIAVDLDDDSLIDPILAVLPPVLIAKKGRKGLTAFYRSDEALPSKNYRTTDRRGLLDFLSGGKQTVVPPSRHSDTGQPYTWLTERTLLDTPLADLPVFTREHFVAMEGILRAHGWDASEPTRPHGAAVVFAGGAGAASLFRQVNDAALANLHAWVPELGLKRWYRAGGGFKAVAEWRASGSGRPLHSRAPNLSFTSQGIRDFGDGRGYSPIDVVMAALGCIAGEALDWLAPRVGVLLHDPVAAALADRLMASAVRKKAQ
jgi:hypothetical protein